MLRNEDDYQSYFNDTMKAGHDENDKGSVEIMIRSSQDVIRDLIGYGVEFAKTDDGALAFTREGAHSNKRILFHEDITGKEITSHLLEQAKKRPNITMKEYTTMIDILTSENEDREGGEQPLTVKIGQDTLTDRALTEDHCICRGAVIRNQNGEMVSIVTRRTSAS